MAPMPKTQVLGAMTYEFIGCSVENQRLILEIAQALNTRNRDVEARAANIRKGLELEVEPPPAICQSPADPKWLGPLVADKVTTQSKSTPAPNAALSEFFRPRKGLWFSDHKSFTDRVLASARDDDIDSIEGCDFISLPRDMYDSEIIAEYLGGSGEKAKKYAFTLNQVKTYIAAQVNGEDGLLLIDGRANIFYVVGKNGVLFAVAVRRLYNEWRVVAWHLDEDGYWDAGDRIFHNKR